ncbi:hypothetical protein M5689_012598 [Euphorbia peplus]|nr:hypothetical protein M5689_012598 [Euphorbia peplus]
MAELMEVKEQIKKAKDINKKSWLASKHLKDELSELKSTLETVRNRKYMVNTVISDLEEQLKEANASVKLKIEEELNAKEMTDRLTEALNETRKEMEVMKWEKKIERSERSKVKQIIRMRKQKLRTLQAMLHAAEIEFEAFGASTAEALSHIQNSETKIETGSFHQFTQEEYYALIAKARDETALAEWRISLSMKQKLTAEINRNLAMSRLRELRRKKRKAKEKEIKEEDDRVEDTEEEDFRARIETQFNNGTTTLKARARPTVKLNQNVGKRNKRQRKKAKLDNKKAKQKNPSILVQVRNSCLWSFRRFFH